jgi:hypothetical protein
MSSNSFSVGERCQWEDRDTNEVFNGTVSSIIPSKRVKPKDWWDTSKYTQADLDDMVTYANVTWDDGTEDAVDIDDLDSEDSELERQFRTTVNSVSDQIHKKLDEASAALSEAVALSEKHGIPFSASVSFLGQSYFPTSFPGKFGELDSDFVSGITGAYTEYYGEGVGWEHSDVC